MPDLEFPILYDNQETLRKETPQGKLAVNEIFYSIQGEGEFTGVPMIFVRVNLCRVGCGFCDTKYTWKFISHNTFYTPEALLSKIKEINRMCKFVCITGGEPFEQDKALFEACKCLKAAGLNVHIETSGSIIIPMDFKEVANWIVCSPKKFNGANFGFPISEAKILVNAHANIDKIRSWIRAFKRRPKITIQPIEPDSPEYGNPEGLNLEQLVRWKKQYDVHLEKVSQQWLKNKQAAIEICKLTGYRLSLQQHKSLRIR
jgi:organic radical activating enzyme